MITCGGCTTTWFGLNMAHCGACHHTFGTVQHFDAHRSQHGSRGKCLDPAALTYGPEGKRAGEALLKLNRHGVWVGNTTRPEYWTATEMSV